MAGDLAGAAALLVVATADKPDRPAGWAMRAFVAAERDDLDEAAALAARALALAPEDPQFANLAVSIALRRGRFAEARDAASAALARLPGNQRARCDLLIACHAMGDERHAALLDYPRLIRIERIAEPPPGFPSTEAFLAAIASAITAAALADPEHPGTMVGGVRLADSFSIASPLARSLRGLLRAMVERVETRDCELVSWANVMRAGDHEKPHIHEAALWSGVFYPRLPAGLADGAGDILFGEHHYGPCVPALPTFRIAPEAGMIILFPSYLPHRTVPFAGKDVRISIAFDAMPTE